MENSDVLLLGGSGRLGRMVRAFWPGPGSLCAQVRDTGLAGPGVLVADPDTADGRTALVQAAATAGAVVCLWGVTPGGGRGEAALDANRTLALRAYEIAREAGVPRLLLASSAAVYGVPAPPESALKEAGPARPAAPYGRAKLEMEQAVMALGDPPGPAVTMLRIGNVAGADAILGGWQPGMALDAVPGGGTPRRSYIGPASLARVLAELCGHPERLPGVLNIAAPGAVAMGDLLDAAGRVWTPRAPGPEMIRQVLLDTGRLERLVRFAPAESGAPEMVAQWRDWMAQQ